MSFKKSLIKQYGDQTYRDHLSTKKSLEDCSYGNAWVAQACGQVVDEEKFRKAILKYATETKYDSNFV